MVQLRTKQMQEEQLRPLVIQYAALCKSYGARLLVNSSYALVEATGADGVHLTANQLHKLAERPLSRAYLVGVSCHDESDLRRASEMGANFALLSPVKCTGSHKFAEPLGWQQFASIVRSATIPVYALGGLGDDDLPAAWSAGAQGVAGISKLWG